jgi:hypothetical protein
MVMAKMVEVTSYDDAKKFWLNTDMIISIMETTFTGETKVIIQGGIMFAIKETANELLAMTNPH